MVGGWREWLVVAVTVPATGVFAIWLAHRIGKMVQWVGHRIVASIERSFAQVVVEVMAPDMAHQATRVAGALDELRESNSLDHRMTSTRLAAVEDRQTDVETRLARVEQRLNIRPPDARTRATDKENPPDE